MKVQKLYCYVDETGQDTKGRFFLVVAIIEKQQSIEILQKKLEKIETSTKKRLLKWTKTPFRVKGVYLNQLSEIKELKGAIFYSTYQETKEYIHLISLTIAKSILSKREDSYTTTIIIDGLKDKEREEVRKELKKLKIIYRKIRGMKDEQDSILRLADCIAGFLRDSIEEQDYTRLILNKLRQARILIKV